MSDTRLRTHWRLALLPVCVRWGCLEKIPRPIFPPRVPAPACILQLAFCPNNNEVHIYKASPDTDPSTWERLHILKEHEQVKTRASPRSAHPSLLVPCLRAVLQVWGAHCLELLACCRELRRRAGAETHNRRRWVGQDCSPSLTFPPPPPTRNRSLAPSTGRPRPTSSYPAPTTETFTSGQCAQ